MEAWENTSPVNEINYLHTSQSRETNLFHSDSPVFSVSDSVSSYLGSCIFVKLLILRLCIQLCCLAPSRKAVQISASFPEHLLVLFLLQRITEMAVRRFCVIRQGSISAVTLISLLSMLMLLLIIKKDRRFKNPVTEVRLQGI